MLHHRVFIVCISLVWKVLMIHPHFCLTLEHIVLIWSVKLFLCRDLQHIGFAQLLLAPPAERQRSFSNADSSVVRRPSVVRPSVVNFSIKSLISQKLSDNFFSFLACSFLRMVPMHSKNMDLVESS